ncbi:hypothetical protein D3C78_1355680 [compost metagenome]
MLSGWVTGRLLPYLYENSAARATSGKPAMPVAMDAAGTADRLRSTLRRVTSAMVVSSFILMLFDASLDESNATIGAALIHVKHEK